MKDELRIYLTSHGTAPGTARLTDDQSLLEAGVIDSTMMLDLIVWLERNHGIKVDEDDMTPENFDSISSIAAYVESKRTGGS